VDRKDLAMTALVLVGGFFIIFGLQNAFGHPHVETIASFKDAVVILSSGTTWG